MYKNMDTADIVAKRIVKWLPEVKKFKSGDYYDLIYVGNNEYYFSLADVSGKGVKAGMYMAKASSTFRALSKLSMPLEKVVFLVQ